jgi:hypothetical protein
VLKEIKRLLKEELYTIAGAKRKLKERFAQQAPQSSSTGNNNGTAASKRKKRATATR